jgi:hypothetical protein
MIFIKDGNGSYEVSRDAAVCLDFDIIISEAYNAGSHEEFGRGSKSTQSRLCIIK